MRRVYRTDSSSADLAEPLTPLGLMARTIGARDVTAIDLPHLGGEPLHVMVIDAGAWEWHRVRLGPSRYAMQPCVPRRPVNFAATLMYWQECIAGTRDEILGDVLVCPRDEYAAAQVQAELDDDYFIPKPQ